MNERTGRRRPFSKAILFVFGVIFAALAPLGASAATELSGSYDNIDLDLTEAGSPYVVEGAVYFGQFSTLRIAGGVVIKFKDAESSLVVHGAVPINSGAATDAPIYFTSYKDDAHGGDTNGDGDASVPAAGDWGFVSFGCGTTFSPSRTPLSFMRVTYGGAPQISGEPRAMDICFRQSGAPQNFIVSDLVIANNLNGLLLAVDQDPDHAVTLQNSSIYGNTNYGVHRLPNRDFKGNDVASPVVLIGNWWGDPSGPYHPSLNPSGTGDAILPTSGYFRPITLSSWLPEDPLPDPATLGCTENCYSSVLFLPGIQGSVLRNGGNMLWPPTVGEVDDDLGALVLNTDGTPVTPSIFVDGVLDTFTIGPLSVPIYAGFSDFMDSLVGDGTIEEWYPLAYDWRYSPQHLIENGILTTQGIVDIVQTTEDLAARSRSGKIIIVAHSMGGLLGKAIIKELIAQGKEDLVESFVMVGSPQLGTPQATAGLLHGEGSAIGGWGFSFVNKAQARALGQSMQSAYNLLPSQRYFGEVLDPPVIFDPTTTLTENWRTQWGITVNDYSEFYQFLSGDVLGTPVRSTPAFADTQNPSVLREDLLLAADGYHQEFDSFEFPESIRVVQIAGWGLDTIEGIEYTEDQGSLDYEPIITVEGDRTVVYRSATASSGDFYYFNLFDHNRALSISLEHRNILSADPIREVVSRLIANTELDEVDNLTMTKPEPSTTGDSLIVSVHSPVTIGAYDSEGKFTGVSYTTPEIQIFTTNIPGSSYLPFGEGKYLIVPNNDSYTFEFNGTGDGTATIRVDALSNEETTTIVSYSDISVSATTRATLTIAPTSQHGELEVDQNGDGELDEIVYPDGERPELTTILARLQEQVEQLDIKTKLKKKLVKTINKLEKKLKKLERKKKDVSEKVTKKVEKFEYKFRKILGRGTPTDEEAEELDKSLLQLEGALE